MSGVDLMKIRESINLTLNQPGALFKVETKAEGVLSRSYGAVDFQNISYTSKDTFEFSDAEIDGKEQIGNNEVLSLLHQGVIYHLMEVDNQDKQWTAFETGSSGWDSSHLAPLFWLQGIEQATVLEPAYFRLSINMEQYIAKQPASTRIQATQALEDNVVGLSTKTLTCELKCDKQGRVEWLSILIPLDKTSISEAVSKEEQSTRTTISLRFLDSPPVIMKPDAKHKYSALEFINSTIEQAKQELSIEKKKEE